MATNWWDRRKQRVADGICQLCAWPHEAGRTYCVRCLAKMRLRNASREPQTPSYRAWANMLTRCSNPRATNYRDYGGRGIKVCARWHEYETFVADMGKRPAGMTLDRIDVNGDYSPENCRWATAREQQNNRRSNRVVEFRGRRMSVADWARETGIRAATLLTRLKFGWPVERALTEPVRKSHDEDA